MKPLTLVALLILLVPSINASQTKTTRTSKPRPTKAPAINSEESLKAAEQQLADAFKNRDKETLARRPRPGRGWKFENLRTHCPLDTINGSMAL
jgi:hypothetical protein